MRKEIVTKRAGAEAFCAGLDVMVRHMYSRADDESRDMESRLAMVCRASKSIVYAQRRIVGVHMAVRQTSGGLHRLLSQCPDAEVLVFQATFPVLHSEASSIARLCPRLRDVRGRLTTGAAYVLARFLPVMHVVATAGQLLPDLAAVRSRLRYLTVDNATGDAGSLRQVTSLLADPDGTVVIFTPMSSMPRLREGLDNVCASTVVLFTRTFLYHIKRTIVSFPSTRSPFHASPGVTTFEVHDEGARAHPMWQRHSPTVQTSEIYDLFPNVETLLVEGITVEVDRPCPSLTDVTCKNLFITPGAVVPRHDPAPLLPNLRSLRVHSRMGLTMANWLMLTAPALQDLTIEFKNIWSALYCPPLSNLPSRTVTIDCAIPVFIHHSRPDTDTITVKAPALHLPMGAVLHMKAFSIWTQWSSFSMVHNTTFPDLVRLDVREMGLKTVDQIIAIAVQAPKLARFTFTSCLAEAIFWFLHQFLYERTGQLVVDRSLTSQFRHLGGVLDGVVTFEMCNGTLLCELNIEESE